MIRLASKRSYSGLEAEGRFPKGCQSVPCGNIESLNELPLNDHDEESGLDCTLHGDYDLPDIAVDQGESIGKYLLSFLDNVFMVIEIGTVGAFARQKGQVTELVKR